MAQAALPHLKDGSAIVNSGSVTGIEWSKDLLDYSATKGAIHAFGLSLQPAATKTAAQTSDTRPEQPAPD